jgi:hypothetical protein
MIVIVIAAAPKAFADDDFNRIPLFHVSTDTVEHFKGRMLEYSARVNGDCSFDANKPVDVGWRLPTGELKGLGFGESGYVKMDIKGAIEGNTLVGEIKFLEREKVHWPLRVVMSRDESGHCHPAAFGLQPQGAAIQNVKLVSVDDPVELLITAVQDGQLVEQPLTFNIQ